MDTSVWSLALRRDATVDSDEVRRLRDALDGGEAVFSTGVVLQELLQGYAAPKAGKEIVRRFRALPMITPSRDDYIQAASLRNECRRHGVQIGTIDALLAQLCINRELVMLSTDHDFAHVAKWTSLRLWGLPR